MSEPSSATLTIIDYIKMRNLDVICDDTNLVTHQFPITSITWRHNKHGEIMKSQQVNVEYENSLVITNAVLNAVTTHRWNGHRQVKMVITRHCSNGYVYEIYWKTFTMRLPQLLPPNGYAYELVAKFLMSEQRLLDEGPTDEESDVEGSDNDHEDDEDDKSSQSGHEDDDDDQEIEESNDKSSQSGHDDDNDGTNKRKADCLGDGDDDDSDSDGPCLGMVNSARLKFDGMYRDRNPRCFACDACISAGKQDVCVHDPAVEPPAQYYA